jgi:hypothetical protein
MIFSRNKQKIEIKFWQWFEANSVRLINFELDQEAIFAEISKQLEKVHKDLTFEFGPLENSKREFVVTADGIKAAFPAVESLVHSAPIFKDWTIVAFRQPQGIHFVIEMDGHKISADDIWFATEPDGDKTGLYLFIRNLSPDNQEILGQASFILLDAALGEFVVETKIGFIERNILPPTPESTGLLPFRLIQQEFGIDSK